MKRSKRNYEVRIPNSFLDEFTRSADLKLACVLYSFVDAKRHNLLGFEVSISQETLARYCGVSVSTVRRSVCSLSDKGFILSQKRESSSDGMLGVYTYTLRIYNRQSSYFLLNRELIRQIDNNDFRVYAYFCRCKRANGSLWHSYKDISEYLKLSRSAVISCIARLIQSKHIYRKRRITSFGDYTENFYIVSVYERGAFRHKKIVPPTAKSADNTNSSYDYVTSKVVVYQGVLQKKVCCLAKNFDTGGGTDFDGS